MSISCQRCSIQKPSCDNTLHTFLLHETLWNIIQNHKNFASYLRQIFNYCKHRLESTAPRRVLRECRSLPSPNTVSDNATKS